MKRSKWIAAVWIAAITIPALMASVFLIGCCALPFHGVIHKVMPLCEIAAHVMRGEHGDDHHHDNQTAPLPEKHDPANRTMKFLRPTGITPPAVVLVATSPAPTPAANRSFITPDARRSGAVL